MRRTWMTMLLALLPVAAVAQSAPVDAVAAELAKVNATLEEIATLLSRQSDLQGVELLMKRVQLSDSQGAELERLLRNAEDELRWWIWSLRIRAFGPKWRFRRLEGCRLTLE